MAANVRYFEQKELVTEKQRTKSLLKLIRGSLGIYEFKNVYLLSITKEKSMCMYVYTDTHMLIFVEEQM